jgi:uncharacterized protein (TIGR00255 family)
MTGYGKSVCELDSKKITIEVKSLNSKQLDLNMRIPGLYKEKEMLIRNEVSKQLERGKVDVAIYLEATGASSSNQFNAAVVKDYFNQLRKIQEELGFAVDPAIIREIIRLPEVLDTQREELNEPEWDEVFLHLVKAIQQVKEFRNQEGETLERDIRMRIETIVSLSKEVFPFEAERIETIRTRLNDNLKEFANGKALDGNRLEQEIIYYLEKFDITEEKVRLANHCSYFTDVISEAASPGKKLGFISQEIGREINTLGSKANHHEIQRIVVKMKDELEKIKEQLLNVL